jgi:hypothetical protein
MEMRNWKWEGDEEPRKGEKRGSRNGRKRINHGKDGAERSETDSVSWPKAERSESTHGRERF